MHPLDLLEGLSPGYVQRLLQKLLASGDTGLSIDELVEDQPPASVAAILAGLMERRLVMRNRVGGKIVYIADCPKDEDASASRLVSDQ